MVLKYSERISFSSKKDIPKYMKHFFQKGKQIERIFLH